MKNMRDRAFKDYKQGAKIADIAAKYNVSVNTVKSWARRHWKLKKGAEVATKSNRVQPRPHGAPRGNQNNLIHGAYGKVFWDVLENDDECGFINHIERDPEQVLKDVVIFYMLRERRLFKLQLEISRTYEAWGMHFYNRVTHITRKWNGDKFEKVITRIPSYIRVHMSIERELTKISNAKIKVALLLSKLKRTNKASPGAVKKIYGMVETVEKVEARINKVFERYMPQAA